MISEIEKALAFVERNFRVLLSYKLAFVTTLVNVAFSLFSFVFFGFMFGQETPQIIAGYHMNFVSYLFVGSISWGFLWGVMSTIPMALRQEMVTGTFENIFLTNTSFSTMVLAYTFYGCLFGSISVALLIPIGALFFGVLVFANAGVSTVIIFLLSVLIMIGFGMILGGIAFWVKDIGQTIIMIQSISTLFSGVYFPINVLPSSLQSVAYFFPFYYSVEGLRRSLIPSISLQELLPCVMVLFALALCFLVLGMFSLNEGLRKAKKEGSLALY